MSSETNTVNVLLCGIGGQGILLLGEIIAEAATMSGYDVKKSELHGMSQRGGSVDCGIRWGKEIFSPVIPQGNVNYLVSLSQEETERYQQKQADGCEVIEAPEKLPEGVPDKRCLNIFMLGKLSQFLEFSEDTWMQAMEKKIRPQFLEGNVVAFNLGRKQ